MNSAILPSNSPAGAPGTFAPFGVKKSEHSNAHLRVRPIADSNTGTVDSSEKWVPNGVLSSGAPFSPVSKIRMNAFQEFEEVSLGLNKVLSQRLASFLLTITWNFPISENTELTLFADAEDSTAEVRYRDVSAGEEREITIILTISGSDCLVSAGGRHIQTIPQVTLKELGHLGKNFPRVFRIVAR